MFCFFYFYLLYRIMQLCDRNANQSKMDVNRKFGKRLSLIISVFFSIRLLCFDHSDVSYQLIFFSSFSVKVMLSFYIQVTLSERGQVSRFR